MGKKIVFATNNKHKLTEIRAIVPAGFDVISLSDINCRHEIPETEDTLKGNADLKAHHVVSHHGMDCFADDTGLEVDALNGQPGVLSARYAGEDGNAEKNIDKLLREMEGISLRTARFRTVISLILNGRVYHFEGVVEGNILHERRGSDGFGYDPVFQPLGYVQSFAEMPLSLKNSISHRGRAVRKLIDFLTNDIK